MSRLKFDRKPIAKRIVKCLSGSESGKSILDIMAECGFNKGPETSMNSRVYVVLQKLKKAGIVCLGQPSKRCKMYKLSPEVKETDLEQLIENQVFKNEDNAKDVESPKENSENTNEEKQQ